MNEDQIEELLKKLILENMSVSVDVTPEPYTDGEVFNIRVTIGYDGDEINSYSDTIVVSKNY